MCTYILVTLPSQANTAILKPIFEAHDRLLIQMEYETIQSQVPTSERFFYTTLGFCDCNSNIGRDYLVAELERDQQRQIEKLRKKGWSENKISRALEQRKHSPQHRLDEFKRDIHRWMDLIMVSLQSKATSHIGILRHNCSTDIGHDSFEIHRIEKIHYNELTEYYLAQLEVDVLYLVTR